MANKGSASVKPSWEDRNSETITAAFISRSPV